MSAPQKPDLAADAQAMLDLLREVLKSDDSAVAELRLMGIEPPTGGYELTERIRAMVAKHEGGAK